MRQGTDSPAIERILRVGGLRLQVRESGEGRPLLLLNGIGAHVRMWRPLERALGPLRLIAFDAPGAGRSQTPPLPLTLPGHARVAERVLDALGYERVDVLGYSFGGIVAQHLAYRAPARIRRLVLAATTPGWGGVSGSMRAMIHISTPLRYYSRAYYERSIGSLVGGRARSDAAWLARHGEERMQHPPHPLGYAWQLAALSVPPGSLPWLHELPHPTLVVTGDDDPLLPAVNSMLLAERIPRARLLVAAGEGHLLLLDPDSAAHPVIRDFLASAEPGRSDAFARTVAVDGGMVAAALPRRPQPHLVWALNAATRALYSRARGSSSADGRSGAW
ncbi:MAG TPA: alpha/beta fold hydrolase [Candidatus Limnocylindria bacterium]|nr:alpha/beta fold hydrolase [Candidatus Limnocylindria bacterium]